MSSRTLRPRPKTKAEPPPEAVKEAKASVKPRSSALAKNKKPLKTPKPSNSSQPILPFVDAEAWETWLRTEFEQVQEADAYTQRIQSFPGIWMKVAKKNSGIRSITCDQALDIALCYGWIDGQRKSLDEQYFIQKFTPRRKNSLWSQRNVAKVAHLIDTGRMRPSGQKEIEAAKADGRWDRAYAGPSKMKIPPDLEALLENEPEAQERLAGLNSTQRYSLLWPIETAKKQETREARIRKAYDVLMGREA